ncbi:MAG TPA: MoxR family ATPase [Candidatus Lumbricidophila sp.]|nr:MoxR family ATPase [Candidatus Lumbricidophila sp.]
MKFNDTLLEVVKIDLETGQVPALMGEPGIGKSSFVESLARSMDTKSFTLACNQLADKADLTGARLVPTPDGQSFHQEFYPHAIVQQAIEYARNNPREWPILFFDEVNRTTSDVTSAVLTMITMRQLGKEKLPDNLRMMVAGNDKGNVTTLDEASLSRFSIYRVEPEAATLIDILGPELNPYVKAVLVEHPHLVFQKSKPTVFAVDGDDDDDNGSQTAVFADLMDAGEEMRQLTTPRTIDGVSRWLNAVDPTKLQTWLSTATTVGDRQTTVLNEILEGHLGDTDFTTFLVAKIAAGLSAGQGNSTSTQLSAPKPACFDSLKQAQSITDLENLIQTLTEHEKSGSLLYSLYEKADNSRLIESLAGSFGALEGDHNRLLIQLASQSLLDSGNVDALTRTSGPVADGARMLLSAFN